MNDMTPLRKEIRALLPDNNIDPAKAPEIHECIASLQKELEDFTQKNPDFTALDIRRRFYELIPDMAPLFIYRNSPFYYEAGTNGGWYVNRPGTTPRAFTQKFIAEKIPQEDLQAYIARREQNYILCCGFFTDEIHHIPPLQNILAHGFKYYHEKVLNELPKCQDEDERRFLETAAAGLEAVHRLQLRFVDMAEKILSEEQLTPQQTSFMKMIADAAKHCPWEPPRTFYEALNTLWFSREILALVDGLAVFALGRVDAFLIDYYDADLKAGRLTKDEAYDLICRFLTVADCHYDGMSIVESYSAHELEIPITLGGCDKNGAPVFNDITKMVLKAHQELDIVFPKLHCRFDENSPHEYLATIAKMVCDTHCVFALFNDSHNIPALVESGVPLEWARTYIGTGCWDGYVDSITDVDTANYVSVARALEAAIYQDKDLAEKANLTFRPLDDCPDFDTMLNQFYDDFIAFVRDQLRMYTDYGKLTPLSNPHPTYSACINSCIENRKDVTAGGCDQKPRIITLAFTANVVDSLCAIKTLCFDRHVCTVRELLDAVRRNWEGAEGLRAQAIQCPHWGDNSELSNRIMGFIYDSVYRDICDLKNDRGGPYLIAAWIYREYRFWGEKMRALPDGRHNGDYLSQGLVPSEFRNKEAITTVLNAIGSLHHENIFASNCNMSFDKNTITPEILEAIFRTFASKGIHLLQPNCFSREDLLDAQIHPERHQNLIIKICGFSARFVSLNAAWQAEVLQRHQYAN
ncbi:MAG: hypothetical protein J6X55_08215 [Victivallales bacterium]|nr:hypothetical protein [Victivallales bacterium]